MSDVEHGLNSTGDSDSTNQNRQDLNRHPENEKARHGRRQTDPVYRVQNQDDKAQDNKVQGDKAQDDSDKKDKKNDDKKDDQKDDKGDDKGDDKPRSKKPLIILAVVVLVLAIIGLIWWFMTRNQVSTDDAYTDGNAVVMAPTVSGYVVSLQVNDNVYVHKGDVLVQIDDRDYVATRDDAAAQVDLARAQLESAKIALAMAHVQYPMQRLQAQAQVESAQANLKQARASDERVHAVDRRAVTDENIDTASAGKSSAQANEDSARAQLKIASLVHEQLLQAQNKVAVSESQLHQAQAKLAAAELNVAYCHITAPSDGWITKRNVQLGSFLAAGTPMFMLVTPDVWVTANFKESQLTRMRVGDQVTLDIDAYPDLELHGHVDSIQLGSGSRFSAFPTENATGNFVKIVQRVPVKIVIDRGLDPHRPLPLGISVSPVVAFK